MSRWTRRSDAEKAEIARKQAEQWGESRAGKVEMAAAESDKAFHDIIAAHEFPLRCEGCGKWTGSDKYYLRTEDGIFGKTPMMWGICRHCGHKARFAVKSPMDDMNTMMTKAMLVTLMNTQGRVTDQREKKEG